MCINTVIMFIIQVVGYRPTKPKTFLNTTLQSFLPFYLIYFILLYLSVIKSKWATELQLTKGGPLHSVSQTFILKGILTMVVKGERVLCEAVGQAGAKLETMSCLLTFSLWACVSSVSVI